MKNKILDNLVSSGQITHYEYSQLDEYGSPNKKSYNRNTEELVIYFPNEQKIIIRTFCSGFNQNTIMVIED